MEELGRELQDRLQDRLRAVFFKSLLAGLFFWIHIKNLCLVSSPGAGLGFPLAQGQRARFGASPWGWA